MSWLQDIATADGVSLEEAASYVVRLGIAIDVEAYLDIGREGRAALVAATEVQAMEAAVEEAAAEGRDIDAARAYANVDGGRAAARLMAKAAGEGVSRALRETKGPTGG